MSERSLLSECLYALNEAMVNSECAMTLETRPEIKKQFEEDYIYFSCLKKRISVALDDNKMVKRGIK